MQVYLIRHAAAVDSDDDFARPLSARGHAQVESLVRHFRSHDVLHPAEVWHSPLLRAKETALGLAHGLGWKIRFKETHLLEPECDPRQIAKRVQAATKALALVAHEPILSALGSLLVNGSPRPVVFEMRKGDVLALERPASGGDGRWVEQWHVGPDQLGRDA